MRIPKCIFILPVLFLWTGCDDLDHMVSHRSTSTDVEVLDAAPTPATAGTTGAEGRVAIPLDDVVDGEISLARNFYFIFDGSGSMGSFPPSAGDQSFPTKLAGAKWAVAQFMEHVPEDVNFGLWIFDNMGAREAVALGPGIREDFLAAIQTTGAGGGTPLAEAIHHGVDQLVAQYRHQLGYGEYRLVVVTDGEADGIPQAAAYAEKFGMPIYTIGFCVGENHPLRAFSVSYRTANSAADLQQGLQEAIAESDTFDPTVFEGLE